MNYTEIIDKINSLRRLIAAEMQEGDYIVSLLDKDGNILTKGRYGTGSEEYGYFISFKEDIKEIDDLTVGHIKKWLAATSFTLYKL